MSKVFETSDGSGIQVTGDQNLMQIENAFENYYMNNSSDDEELSSE
jgi:hypothetical protein